MARKGKAHERSRTVTATEFKAKCLRLLDELRPGDELVVTKRGKPIAIVRSAARPTRSPWGLWKGRVEILGDIVRFSTADEWDALK